MVFSGSASIQYIWSKAKEEANKIAASIVKKQIEKNTCQNIACRHLKSKHLGDKRQCMVVTCPCSEFMKKA